jgi:hypothetical protein
MRRGRTFTGASRGCLDHRDMSTGATISLIAILVVAGVLQAIAFYLLYALFRDKEMKH